MYTAQLSCETSLKGRLVSIDGLRAVGTEVLLRVTSLDSSGPETILIQPEKGRL